MRKRIKYSIQITIITLLITSLFSISTDAQIRQVPTAGIAINGKMVNGINPIIIDGIYYLPFVNLAKILGYNEISFERNTLTYEVTDGSTPIRATMGGTLAKKSNEYIHIAPPRWINGTGYIPFDSVGNLFNVDITFNPQNGSIQVHKPARYYVVHRNDTLWRISRAHHTNIYRLKEANNLTSNLIFAGQKLRLPTIHLSKELEPMRERQPIVNDTPNSNFQDIRNQVVDVAHKYIGAHYKFGASLSEAPQYFDCSSFTKTVFSTVGITLPRVSRFQASKGNFVSGPLVPGDLMFFTNKNEYSDGRIGHVGIYIGNGRMIHASSSHGVTITDHVLGNPYWSHNYLFSKRIIK